MDVINSLSFWFTVAEKQENLYKCTRLFSFWIRNSFTSMDSKSGNDGTDENIGKTFCEYPNDEEESSQIETG